MSTAIDLEKGGCEYSNKASLKFENDKAITRPPAKRKSENISPLANIGKNTKVLIDNIFQKEIDV